MGFCLVNAIVSLLWCLYYYGQECKQHVWLTHRGVSGLFSVTWTRLCYYFLFSTSLLLISDSSIPASCPQLSRKLWADLKEMAYLAAQLSQHPDNKT